MHTPPQHTGTIWKYPMTPNPLTIHEVPKGAKALHVGPDPQGTLCVWFMVDPKQPKVKRGLVMVGTGHTLPLDAANDYVGTFVIDSFVNHVFAPAMDVDQ